MTTPLEQAYSDLGENLIPLIDFYFINGYVYSGNDIFVLAYTRKSEEWLDKDDVWYVQYAAGNLSRLFALCPEELEWVEIERMDGRTRRYPFRKLKEKIHGIAKNAKAASASCTACN